MFAARSSLILIVLLGACVEAQRPPPEKLPQPVAIAEPRPEPPREEPEPEAKATPPPPPKKQHESAPAPVAKAEPSEAPLDLKGLVQRLQDTDAIGLFTKVALKNQVDDLLGELRAVYGGKSQKTLADLRQPYDLLVMKVLALLQDKDPSLAKDLTASKEQIWAFLADPQKFSTI